MKVRLLTYATRDFLESARELALSASRYGIETELLGPRSPVMANFRRRHADIMRARRGAGYWLWKPHIILHALQSASADEIVMYSDAGVELIADPAPLARLAADRSILLFHQGCFPGREGTHLIRRWTKRDAMVLTGTDSEEFWNANSLVGGYQLYRRSEASLAFVAAWLQACTDPRILTDRPNTCGLPNLPEFVAHRHDQSVVSLLAHRAGISTYEDPSQYGFRGGEADLGQFFDSHRRRRQPVLATVRARLQLGTRLARARKTLSAMVGGH